MADFDQSLLEDEPVGPFSSPEDELCFWKTRSERLKNALVDTRRTLDEFQQDSRDYEEELERNIELLDAQTKELRKAVGVLQMEVDHWKEKYQESKTDSNSSVEAMQREINFLKTSHEKYKDRTRTLEQDNDDLERFGRVASTSLKDIELRMNQTMERNAFLENELEIKNKLVVVVQRLKDELRDLQLELSVLRNNRTSTQLKRRSLCVKPEENGATPVKMVQEMLGRVKSLEGRLVNCRSLVTPLLTPPPSYASTTKDRATPRIRSPSKLPALSSKSPTPSLKSPTPSLKSPTPSSKSPTPLSKSPTPSKVPTGTKTRNTRARSIRMESTPSRLRRISDNYSQRTTQV